ncbi:hypothetical protein Leryth_016535 [Lithospermum erythrorhizon]|nr:hypothetical protein Leryth_016535 [Lithospermum erythrorhizon]
MNNGISGIGPRVAEAKLCMYDSRRFHGPCFSNDRCTKKCQEESFSGGDCQGLRRKCRCFRNC